MEMQAIRLHPSDRAEPYSPSNPAPSSALHLDTVPIPTSCQPSQVRVKVKASTIVRDTLTWPEMYQHPFTIPGNDLSGIVVEADPTSKFKAGDEVFGMLAADRPGSWAEYAIALENEIAIKPAQLSWEEAAALPLSGMTAYEALFTHAGVPSPGTGEGTRNYDTAKKVLVTGAAGAVGMYVVQLARLAGVHVTAVTGSNERNAAFLHELGADQSIEYSSLKGEVFKGHYDIVIDTVGGQPLVDAWRCVKANGALVTVDSSSFNFVEEHRRLGVARDDVKALFFIVEGGRATLDELSRIANTGRLRIFVLDVYPLQRVREAYDYATGRLAGRWKVILSV